MEKRKIEIGLKGCYQSTQGDSPGIYMGDAHEKKQKK
jgi:hypothetical protein